MEKDAVLVCTVLGFLGSVAVTLGFVANSYSSKSVEYDGTNCVYRSPPATGLGILGVFLVLTNQVIVAAYTSGWCLCLCCCCPCWTKRRRLAPTPSKRRRLGIILSLFSWVLTIVAVVEFILGVTESSREEAPISRTPRDVVRVQGAGDDRELPDGLPVLPHRRRARDRVLRAARDGGAVAHAARRAVPPGGRRRCEQYGAAAEPASD